MLAALWSALSPTCLPPSRRARLAGDLIEACALPNTALSRPVPQSMRGGYVTWWTVAIGVDTHKQQHVAVALDRLGRQIGALTVEATTAGYRQLLVWARGRGEPVFGIEGCGSYGAGLARFLAQRGAAVYECERPHRRERRGGKNDLVDATLAARRVVSGEGLSLPRGDGSRERLRRLLLERRGAVRARTAALNQLDGLIVTGPDLRGHLTGVGKRRLVGTVARLRPRSGAAPTSCGESLTTRPGPTTSGCSPTARPPRKPDAASNARSPATSTTASENSTHPP